MAKSLDQIQSIGVVGAGTMGAGIAQVCAAAGYKTMLFDLNPAMCEKAMAGIKKNLAKAVELGKSTQEKMEQTLSNLSTVSETSALKVDLVIEAIIEKTEPKQQLFQALAELNGDDCILASNTSSIPITRIARGIPHPERVVGMHFFNPAHLMKLVEVISGEATSSDVAETIKALTLKLGKVPVMAKDAPGFIVNRVARPYYVESLKLLEEQVADFETIDALLENNGFKMGPFRLQDLIGIDTNFSVTSSMYESFHYEPRFRPNRLQQQKVEAGFHGKKSGRGWYDYNA